MEEVIDQWETDVLKREEKKDGSIKLDCKVEVLVIYGVNQLNQL